MLWVIGLYWKIQPHVMTFLIHFFITILRPIIVISPVLSSNYLYIKENYLRKHTKANDQHLIKSALFTPIEKIMPRGIEMNISMWYTIEVDTWKPMISIISNPLFSTPIEKIMQRGIQMNISLWALEGSYQVDSCLHHSMAPPSSVRQSQSTKEERSEYPKLRAIYQHVLRTWCRR